MRRLLVLVLTLLLLLVSLPAALVSAEGGKPIPDAVAEMIERASVDGPLPVIVTLPSIDAQRGVIASLDGLDAIVRVRYELFPLLALTAGPNALETLARSDAVLAINEDIPQLPGPRLDAASDQRRQGSGAWLDGIWPDRRHPRHRHRHRSPVLRLAHCLAGVLLERGRRRWWRDALPEWPELGRPARMRPMR
ncbi:MAG: hypothetical protein V9F06_13715 [Thermomicrobiales bacterium]